jgi:hypothetical protein
MLATASPAASQPVQFAELAGKTIETTAGETRIARAKGKDRAQTARFRTVHKFGDDGKFTLTLYVNIDDELMGKQSNQFRGASVIGKPFPFRDGQRVFVFENAQLTWMRTMGEGASIGIITLAREGVRLTCSYKTTPATEPGSRNLKVDAHGGWSEARFFNVKQLGTTCKVLS